MTPISQASCHYYFLSTLFFSPAKQKRKKRMTLAFRTICCMEFLVQIHAYESKRGERERERERETHFIS
jgi:hypothetical protein